MQERGDEAVKEELVERGVAKRLKGLALLDEPYIKNDKTTAHKIKRLLTQAPIPCRFYLPLSPPSPLLFPLAGDCEARREHQDPSL